MGFRSNANIVVVGNISQDVRVTEGDKAYASFNIAVENRTKTEDNRYGADFYTVKCFGQAMVNYAKHCIKGAKVTVIGNFVNEKYTTRDGNTGANLTIYADSIIIQKYADNDQNNAGRTNSNNVPTQVDDDDDPFGN